MLGIVPRFRKNDFDGDSSSGTLATCCTMLGLVSQPMVFTIDRGVHNLCVRER